MKSQMFRSVAALAIMALFSLSAASVYASPYGDSSAYGKILKVDAQSNSLTIWDKSSNRAAKFFAHSNELSELQEGDSVRVTYQAPSGIPQSISKM